MRVDEAMLCVLSHFFPSSINIIDRMRFDDYVTTVSRRTTSRVFLAKKKLPSRCEQTWTGYRVSFLKREFIALRLHMTADKNDKVVHPRKKRRLLHRLIDKRSRVFRTFTRGHVRQYYICTRLSFRLRRLMRNRNLNTETGTIYHAILRER